jgi:hypothetical protein
MCNYSSGSKVSTSSGSNETTAYAVSHDMNKMEPQEQSEMRSTIWRSLQTNLFVCGQGWSNIYWLAHHSCNS